MERQSSQRSVTGRSVGPVLRVVATCVATLAVIELLLRIFDPLGISYFPAAARYFRNMRPDDAYAYIHRPGYHDKLEGVEVSINSHGFRGPERLYERKVGVSRLLVLGDSVVFGWGVPQDSIFAVRLQRRFEADGMRWQVLPAGVGSWNTRTEYEYFRDAGLGFDPDAVLVVATNNDVVPNLAGRTDVTKALLSRDGPREKAMGRFLGKAWRAAAGRSYLLSQVQYFVRRNRETQAYSEITEDSPRWVDARKALVGIIELCRDRSIPLAFCLYTSEEKLEKDKVLSLYKGYLDEAHIPVVMLPDALFRERAYRNSFVDGHANSRGQAVIAKRLYDALKPVLDGRGEGDR